LFIIRLVYPSDRACLLDSVREVCSNHLNVSFDKLCQRCINQKAEKPEEETNEDDQESDKEIKEVTEDHLRKLLFSDFGDPKNDDRFYKEVLDLGEFR